MTITPCARPKARKRRLVAASGDHAGDRHDRHRRPGAETRRRQPGGQPAPVRKPFQRIPHCRAVDEAGADAAQPGRHIQEPKHVRSAVEHPGQPDQRTPGHHRQLGADPVDHVAFERQQPGFADDEHGESDLDGGAAPVMRLVDRQHEQRPAILQVGDHHHAHDTQHQLAPARVQCRHPERLLRSAHSCSGHCRSVYEQTKQSQVLARRPDWLPRPDRLSGADATHLEQLSMPPRPPGHRPQPPAHKTNTTRCWRRRGLHHGSVWGGPGGIFSAPCPGVPIAMDAKRVIATISPPPGTPGALRGSPRRASSFARSRGRSSSGRSPAPCSGELLHRGVCPRVVGGYGNNGVIFLRRSIFRTVGRYPSYRSVVARQEGPKKPMPAVLGGPGKDKAEIADPLIIKAQGRRPQAETLWFQVMIPPHV